MIRITKKSIIISIIAVTVIVLLFILVFFEFNSNPLFMSSEMSYASTFGGFSSEGIITKNEEHYIWFSDFASSKKVPFCSNPQCLHNSQNCFAFDMNRKLINEGVSLLTLHDGVIYYTKTVFDRHTDHQYSIEVYSVNIDGSGTRKISTLDGYINSILMYIVDGKIIIYLDIYDDSIWDTDVINDSERMINRTFVSVDIKSGTFWVFPVKQGYGLSLDYAGYYNGIFYYTSTYTIEALNDNDSRTVYREKMRQTLWAANIINKSENIIEQFSNPQSTNIFDMHYFYYTDNHLAHIVIQASTKQTVFNVYDTISSELRYIKTFSLETYGTPNNTTFWQGEWLIFTNHESRNNTAFNIITQEIVSIDQFYEYNFFATVGDRFVLVTMENNELLYLWITIDDFITNKGNISAFTKG
ncbi:MAG: hypothetical protein LBC71_04295 [Oscillospiraceae bacterium]|jgi:hypothetical protein|nr:hypothetical protein [Oscillospiraceae bacterium]